KKVEGWDQKQLAATMKEVGAPASADKAKVNWFMAELLIVIMVIYVTMVYGPIAAFLVELFPTEIRYTSMSLPYHIGNGWFVGFVPLTAAAMFAATGDIYYGLWYPIVVAVMSLIIGTIFLRETKDRDIRTYEHAKARIEESSQVRRLKPASAGFFLRGRGSLYTGPSGW